MQLPGWAPKRNLPKINQVNKKEWLVLSEETKLEGKSPTDVHDDYDSLEYVQYATSNIYPTGSTKKRYKKGEIKG
jgi:hypothetical protein